jgi:hypothetical protein
MREKTKKATFNLHVDVLTALDEVMARKIVPSKNALVERALVKELQELRRQERKALWQEAARDPLFVKDIADIEADFRYADAEVFISLRGFPGQWKGRSAVRFDHHGPPGKDHLQTTPGEITRLPG